MVWYLKVNELQLSGDASLEGSKQVNELQYDDDASAEVASGSSSYHPPHPHHLL